MTHLLRLQRISAVILIAYFVLSPLTSFAQETSSQSVPIDIQPLVSETPPETTEPSTSVEPTQDPNFNPFSIPETTISPTPENSPESSPIPTEQNQNNPQILDNDEDPGYLGGLNGQHVAEQRSKSPERD
jgi:hypothetical protein